MFKKLLTLLRGRSADASEAFFDANSLTLLRQQLRDAASGVLTARKSVAVIMAYAEREKASLAKTNARIADLEARACEALKQGQEDAALEAATAIANLEAERDATERTIATYETELVKMRQTLSSNESLLAEIQRGQRIVEAKSKTEKLGKDSPSWTKSDLTDAAETLARLQERQKLAEATVEAMAELSAEGSADALSDRMAASGFGAPKKTAASDVLDRLRAKAA